MENTCLSKSGDMKVKTSTLTVYKYSDLVNVTVDMKRVPS